MYIDSGQWWKDIVIVLIYFAAICVGIFVIGFCTYQYGKIKQEQGEREEEKIQIKEWCIKKAEDKAEQAAIKQMEEAEQIRRIREHQRRKQEEERKEQEEKLIFEQGVEELIAFKRKYGLDAVPHTKHYSHQVRREAHAEMQWQIRHAEILTEMKEKAQQFYKIHNWQAVPEKWHENMNKDERAIWEKERQKAKNTKKDKGNARLLKALEKLDGHKNS